MRRCASLILILALGVMGCSETSGTGGTAGDGGNGPAAPCGRLCEDASDCDDINPCTSDTCDVADGTCVYMPVEDGSACGSSRICVGGDCRQQCESNANCQDDFNPCTDDSCDLATETCIYAPVENGTGYPEYVCVAGEHEAPCRNDGDCDDHNECTLNECVANGLCGSSDLEDGTPCAGGVCQSGQCALQGSVLPCTEQGIRNAIAATGGPYTFACDGPTTIVTTSEIELGNDVVLNGQGKVELDGNESHRLFSIPRGVTAKLCGFSVTKGGGDFGGGIRSEGTLTIASSTIAGNGVFNPADPPGDTTLTGGGIWSGGTLKIMRSSISGNTATGEGGGILNDGTLSISASTVSGNTLISPLGDGAGIKSDGTLVVLNSAVSGNSPGAIWGQNELMLVNSTVSGTISGWKASVQMVGVLVAGSCTGWLDHPDPPTVVSGGYNVESDGNTCGFDQPSDQVGVSADDLKLGPLQDNGGPTETHALGAGSVAIDQIPAVDCAVSEDQRGVARPQGDSCDVGAFELEVGP